MVLNECGTRLEIVISGVYAHLPGDGGWKLPPNVADKLLMIRGTRREIPVLGVASAGDSMKSTAARKQRDKQCSGKDQELTGQATVPTRPPA